MSDALDPDTEILRRLTPQQRMRAGMNLYHFARRLKLTALRTKHPDLSESDLKTRLNESFLYARD
jgi:hypothetical protein